MNLQVIWWKVIDQIKLAKDKGKRLAVVKTVINIRVR
jgi:hypothetical protein